MTAPVDVLAAMDEMRLAASEHYLCMPDDLDTYAKARAAVAELMGKARSLSDYLDAYVAWQREQGGDQFGADIAEHDVAEFRAALARCKGGAA